MADLQREIELWAPQMGEHALFLHLLLHDPALKQRGLEIFHRWQLYICQNVFNDVQRVLELVNELEAYKTEVLNRLLNGEWIGATYPQFVDHILRELRYFKNRLLGAPLAPEQEVKFWNTINSEHAGFASHLLDPTEEASVDKADATMKEIRNLPSLGDEASIIMAIEAGINLTNFNIESYGGILNNKVRSVIHPTLLRHVIREGQIGQNVLGKMINEQQIDIVIPDICQTNL